jgi:hypothetical protein
MFIQTVAIIPKDDSTDMEIGFASLKAGYAAIYHGLLGQLADEFQKEGITISVEPEEIKAIRLSIHIKGASPELEKKIRSILGQV